MFDILSARSNQWSTVRKNFLKTHDFCSGCGSKKKLIVHHIEPFHICPEKELDTNNLITLCGTCHFVFGHLMDWQSWNTNVVEDCMVYYNKIQNKPKIIQAQKLSILRYITNLINYYEK